ncbi:uncharacterized protein [Musca autumnalis]|uniref:uncharacterized protein n=1 Tax=Musca autumnalis TaxID=221902 RepID=UPI003CFB10A2
MKLFIATLSCVLLVANALTYIPSSDRLRRDVSELLAEPNKEYLPPTNEESVDAEVTTALPMEEVEVQDTAVLGENGYEYKTVKRVVVRSRRDVSHLNLNYLPPFESKKPSNEYLPPVTSEEHHEETQPSKEYLPPAETKEAEAEKEVEIATEAPEPSREYLPPAEKTEDVKEETVTTEAPAVEEKEMETTPETVTEEKQTEEMTTVAPAEESPAEVKEAVTEAPMEMEQPEHMEMEEAAPMEMEQASPMEMEETAVLAEDGYHYKQPSAVPMELLHIMQESVENPESLTPLEEGVVEAEGPENGESAVLADDGYHYRVIKRRF